LLVDSVHLPLGSNRLFSPWVAEIEENTWTLDQLVWEIVKTITAYNRSLSSSSFGTCEIWKHWLLDRSKETD
jgi:hypothetical protein